MSEASQNCEGKTCEATGACICLPASADGTTPCDSQDGPTTDLFGQVLAHASRSAQRASAKAKPTNGTCGRKCSGSSASADLTRSLASRLRARLDTVGSMEYSQTWKELATPAGRSYWAHTASARRTCDSVYGGWPTVKVATGKYSYSNGDRNKVVLNLEGVAEIAGQHTNSSPAATERRGVLSPVLACWLMGFPIQWLQSVPVGRQRSQ